MLLALENDDDGTMIMIFLLPIMICIKNLESTPWNFEFNTILKYFFLVSFIDKLDGIHCIKCNHVPLMTTP